MDPVFGYPLIITHKPTRKESDYYNVYRINPDSLQDGGGLKISLEYTDRQEHREGNVEHAYNNYNTIFMDVIRGGSSGTPTGTPQEQVAPATVVGAHLARREGGLGTALRGAASTAAGKAGGQHQR